MKDLLADPVNEKWRQYSIEFCGGTHLPNIADAGSFTIQSEESVSKGIRRIVALTGTAASAAMAAADKSDALIAQARAANESDLSSFITALNQSVSTLPLRAKRRVQAAVVELQSRIKAFEKTQAQSNSSSIDTQAITAELVTNAPPLGPGKLVVGEIPDANDDQLRAVMDSLRKKLTSHAIMLGTVNGDKVSFVSAVSDDLIAKGLKAGDWIRETAKIAGGGGGGRPQMAQAGGKDPSKLGEALEKARSFAAATVG
jgi:alanyl-tRNA synthetase